MYNHALTVCSAILLFAGAALAAGPTTSTRTLNVTGTGAAAAPADVDTNGACNVDPWVDQCSETTGCTCKEVTVTTVSGNMDKGTQTVTKFFVTSDDNINAATEPTVPPGPNPRCSPLRGILTDTSSSQSKTLNLFGVACKKIIGISSINPQGNHVSDTIWEVGESRTLRVIQARSHRELAL